MRTAANVSVFSLRDRDLFAAGYTFIHFFHPVKTIARDITIDAWDYVLRLDQTQEKQKWYQAKKRYKTLFSREELFQKALCIIADSWECDQESLSWRTANTYKPGNTDMLLRYIKFLLWRTMDRLPAYRALAMGCLLYGYTPKEVDELTVWGLDNNNFGHMKSRLLKWVTTRFAVQVQAIPPYQEERICGRPVQPGEIDLITTVLRMFTDWRRWTRRPGHPVSEGKVGDLFDGTLSLSPALLGEEQKHALACPQCGGIPQMVENHNHNRFKHPLPAPETMLRIPLFTTSEDAPPAPPTTTERSNPPSITPDDWRRIEAALQEQHLRRRAYHGGTLRVMVDGKEWRRFQPTRTPGLEFAIAEDAERLEVFGEDQQGSILLAVFLLPGPEAAMQQPLELYSRQATGQKIRLCLSTMPKHLAEERGWHVQLTYQEAPCSAIVMAWESLWSRVVSLATPVYQDCIRLATWLRRGAPALAVLLLLSLGGNVWQWWQTAGPRRLEEPRVLEAELAALSIDRLFNAYDFQRRMHSATALGTFVTAYSLSETRPLVRGLFDPYTPRLTFLRIGTRYAEALALLSSGDLTGTQARLEAINQELLKVQAPRVLSAYLTGVQVMLQQPTTPDVRDKVLALFEPLYRAEYVRDSAAEELLLFRTGTWLVNVSLAASAGDKTALQQADAVSYLQRELTRLEAPQEVLTAFAQLQQLMTQPQLADRDVQEILRLVRKIRQMFASQ